jgi:glycosyltransferase involved in cell wall biosynthesis
MQLSDDRPVPAAVRAGSNPGSRPDLVCLSHLRWDFVYQRPQHLMSRFARDRRVFFVEEPIWEAEGPSPGLPRLEIAERQGGVILAVPHLPGGVSPDQAESLQGELLRELLERHEVSEFVLWYYTPMAIPFAEGLEPLAVVYDCMDELSLFRGAPRELVDREARLLAAADLVFTGGQSLYEAKREKHPRVHPFPSSIDAEHFRQARQAGMEPADQAGIPGPRMGYFGVIDERLDLDLLAAVAEARPDWHLVMVGPVVKIDPGSLPQRPNLHWLGMKSYPELPEYLAGWDVALMPFALNESTRFISPTKTPEYLAGGRPVVSTPIRDVVKPYGESGMVEIADGPEAFVTAVDRVLRRALRKEDREDWLRRVDEHLSHGSWSRTWQQMSELIESAVASRQDRREGPSRDLPIL